MSDDRKKEFLTSFMEKGYLLAPDVFENTDFSPDFLDMVDTRILTKEKPLVIVNDIYESVSKKGVSGINWMEFEKSRVLHERGKTNRLYSSFLDLIYDKKEKVEEVVVEKPIVENKLLKSKDVNDKYSLKIVRDFLEEPKEREMRDFVYHYKRRYDFLKKLIVSRPEMQNALSINRISSKEKGESVSLIGLVYDKKTTKKGNIMIKLEDSTGTTNVIFDPTTEDIEFLCLDELIGVVGKANEGFVYSNKLIYPDIIEERKTKKYSEEVCAAFISDVHIGSKMFIEDKFLKFIDWLNGIHKDPKMVELSKKVKYLFVVGDVVDGVGIYPNQDEELDIKSIRGQYDRCTELLGQIRKDIKIVLCPGNHDAKRIAEPQPALDKYAESLKTLNNLTLVSNPSVINVLSGDNFEGFNILLYHGYSYDYYAANIDTILQNGGYDRGDLIMKFLLKKRHLSPVHTATLFVPNGNEDNLVMDIVPDIFASGHIHKGSIAKYKGVTTFVSSCWQHKTDFQERMGHNPDYCKVPFFNFGNGKSMMLDFSEGMNENE
tara:strand:- start:245 stop:1882 length:1638 start_codon:yes stop_codon:yes gene_type:complete